MRNIIWLLTIVAAVAVLPGAGEQSTIKRLDGSKLASAEIDSTVTRLMHAAEVTGVGLAIFDQGKVV